MIQDFLHVLKHDVVKLILGWSMKRFLRLVWSLDLRCFRSFKKRLICLLQNRPPFHSPTYFQELQVWITLVSINGILVLKCFESPLQRVGSTQSHTCSTGTNLIPSLHLKFSKTTIATSTKKQVDSYLTFDYVHKQIYR